MQLQMLTVEFRFSGCGSLKEKRGRLSGLKDRLGKVPSIALAESGFQDTHDRSAWTLILLAPNSRMLDQLQAKAEASLLHVDGELVRQDVETLF